MLTFSDLLIPSDWPLVVGFDTGTFMSCTFTTFCPDPYSALVLAEFPNYRYVGGEPELLDVSNIEWARTIIRAYKHLRPTSTKITGWVDQNSQFKNELARYGLMLRSNLRKLELRVEITREYVLAKQPFRFFMAPWLSVLPYEMEHAKWPDEHTTAGKFDRLKQNDHTLDCFEHTCSRRPRTKRVTMQRDETFLERYLREHRRPDRDIRGKFGDKHLGIHI
jgi:hypothetical protein